MANQPNEGFTDNWAYLKTELGWLDRMLMMALSRYRQDKRDVDRIAKTKADKVSSHWWKGVISLDGKIAYDEHRPNAKINSSKTSRSSKSASKSAKSSKVTVSKTTPGYQQQLESRLKLSRKNGILLALPWFRDRLKLSLFEKNLVLMALAPEVNRRYARLYRYLQSQDDNPVTDLPTVELVLRLLCRNDVEWRRSRTAFHPESPLMRHGLLTSLNDSHDPFLNATLRLNDDFVDCLLAETPDPDLMEQLLNPTRSSLSHQQNWPLATPLPVDFSTDISAETSAVSSSAIFDARKDKNGNDALSSGSQRQINSEEKILRETSTLTNSSHVDSVSEHLQPELSSSKEANPIQVQQTTWDDLVIDPDLKAALKHLSHRLTLHKTVQQKWCNESVSKTKIHPGLVAVFSGPQGAGKRLAAQILAHDLSSTVHCVDLANVMDIDYFQLLDEVEQSSPSVLLIHSAEHWLSRTAAMPYSRLNHLLAHRKTLGSLTIFSVDHKESVAQIWQPQIDQSFQFTLPSQSQRLILWQRVFPPKTKFSVKLDWVILSEIDVSGDAIGAIAHDALIRMLADGAATMKMEHLVAALQWHHIPDSTIQTFVNNCKEARKQALAAQAKQQASKTKKASRKSPQGKSASKPSSTKASANKRTRQPKVSKAGVEDTSLSDPLVADETTPASNAENPTAALPKPSLKEESGMVRPFPYLP